MCPQWAGKHKNERQKEAEKKDENIGTSKSGMNDRVSRAGTHMCAHTHANAIVLSQTTHMHADTHAPAHRHTHTHTHTFTRTHKEPPNEAVTQRKDH